MQFTVQSADEIENLPTGNIEELFVGLTRIIIEGEVFYLQNMVKFQVLNLIREDAYALNFLIFTVERIQNTASLREGNVLFIDNKPFLRVIKFYDIEETGALYTRIEKYE